MLSLRESRLCKRPDDMLSKAGVAPTSDRQNALVVMAYVVDSQIFSTRPTAKVLVGPNTIHQLKGKKV